MTQHYNPQVAVPTVNLNGTGYQSLWDENREAARLVGEARHAIQAMAPHGRDYPGQPDQFYKARAEWSARLSALDHIAAELDLIAFGLKDQKGNN